MSKIDIAKQFYEFSSSENKEKFDALLHPDFRVIESDNMPYAGTYKGADGFREIVSIVFGYFETLNVEPVVYTEGTDHVIALVNVEGVGKRRGEAFKSDLLEVFRFEGEKIIEIRPYYWNQDLIANL